MESMKKIQIGSGLQNSHIRTPLQDSDWLVIAASHAFLGCVKRTPSETVAMGVRIEGKQMIAPLEVWCKNQNHLENLKTAVQFRFISSILAIAFYFPVWHIAQEVGSLF